MNEGVFEKILVVEFLLEVITADEVVVFAILLAGSRCAGGAGNRVMSLAQVCQMAAQRGFPRS